MAAIAVLVPCVATAAHADARPAHSVAHTSTGDPTRIYDATPLPHPSPPGTASADSTSVLEPRSAPPPGVSLEATPQVGATGTAAITSHWIENGYTGAGVKIGVIDWFDAAAVDAAVLSGDLPPLPASRRRCFVGPNQCTFGTPGVFHGNYEANAVFDEAPGAEIYLVEVLDIGGMYTAIDWLASNGVTIVSHTLLTAFDGPGNGTGPAAAAVDYAVYKGIAWFQYGGNFGKDSQYTWYPGSYWRGAWSDPDNDRWLNFTGTDETLGTFCGALMGLRWSDWGAARTDYELWAADVKIATGTVSTAIRITDFNQAAGAAPLEGNDLRWLCNSNPAYGVVYDTNNAGYVALKVKRSLRSTAASATGDIMELEVLNGYFEYAVDANSIAVPFADSKNLGEATVIGQTSRGGSHGPTNDGRVKPDLSTKTSPSASPTAQAAGAAAVVRSALGEMKPWQLVQYFRNYTTIVAGTEYHPTTEPTVPSNNVGYGYVSLRGNGPPRTPLAPSKINASSFRLLTAGSRRASAPPPRRYRRTAHTASSSATRLASAPMAVTRKPCSSTSRSRTPPAPGMCRCRRAGGASRDRRRSSMSSAPARRWPTSWRCRSGPSAKSPSTPAAAGTSSSTLWVAQPASTPTSSTPRTATSRSIRSAPTTHAAPPVGSSRWHLPRHQGHRRRNRERPDGVGSRPQERACCRHLGHRRFAVRKRFHQRRAHHREPTDADVDGELPGRPEHHRDVVGARRRERQHPHLFAEEHPLPGRHPRLHRHQRSGRLV
jgi:hypothetical protein